MTDTRSRTMITFLSATFAANLEDLRLYAPFVGLESQNVNDVGFASCELLGTPDDEALPEGFRRPIFCAVKGPGA